MEYELNRQEKEDKLQHFLFEIDAILDEFIEELESKGYLLDYSLESIDSLEDYIINEGIDISDKDVEIREKCWIYLGEAFLKLIGKGIWEISMNKENTINYGLYVVTNYRLKGVEFVPSRLIENCISKQKKGFLRAVIEYNIKPEKINLDHIPFDKN